MIINKDVIPIQFLKIIELEVDPPQYVTLKSRISESVRKDVKYFQLKHGNDLIYGFFDDR